MGNKGSSTTTTKPPAFLDTKCQVSNDSSVIPAQPPSLQERGRPARLTGRALRLREKEVLDSVLLILLTQRRVRGHLSRHAKTAHGTRYLCFQRSAVPKVHHLLQDDGLFLNEEEEELTKWPVLLWDIPAACCRAHPQQHPKGSRKGMLSQQRPSQTFCRLFILALLTAIRPKTRPRQKKHVKPNLSTFTPAPSPEQPLDFSSVLPTSASMFEFFLDCLFDELGHKCSSPSPAVFTAHKAFAF